MRKLLLIAVGLALPGCLAAHPHKSESALEHVADDPAAHDVPSWLWANESDDEFERVVAVNLPEGMQGKVLPADDPVAKRIEFWQGRIDAMIRERFPQRLAGVPVPKARVFAFNASQAMVPPAIICVDDAEIAVKSAGAAALVSDGGVKILPEMPPCIHRSVADDPLLAGLRSIAQNSPGATPCRFALAGGSPRHVAVSDCAAAAPTGTSVPLLVLGTSVHPSYMSALIIGGTEAQAIATMAHELGHYYKLHAVTGSSVAFGEFYPLASGADAALHQPTSATRGATASFRRLRTEKQALTDQIAAAQAETIDGIYAPVPGQKVHSGLLAAMSFLLVQAAETEPTCAESAKGLDRLGFSVAEHSPLLVPLGASDAAQWLKAEGLILTCLKTIRVGAGAFDAEMALTLSDQTLLSVLAAKEASIKVAGSVADYWLSLSDILASNYPAYDRAAAARYAAQQKRVNDLRKAQSALQTEIDAFGVKADAEHWGVWTFEEEADDLSLEWLVGLGLDPRAGIEAMFADMAEDMGPGELGLTKCRELYRQGFKNDQGEPLFAPIGQIEEPHHTACFRVATMQREIVAHGWLAHKFTAPSAPGPTWLDLQKSLK